MDLHRLWVSTLVATTTVLVGCSNSKQLPLRTTDQSAKFVLAIARGGDTNDWQLAPSATHPAVRAWADRGTIQGLGKRLRHEGLWACAFADDAGQLRTVGKGFTFGDRESVTGNAKPYASHEKINALLHETLELPDSELVETAVAVCG